jgi:hypothetical protein
MGLGLAKNHAQGKRSFSSSLCSQEWFKFGYFEVILWDRIAG